ncbi:MAG: hypothetical protein AAGI22_22965 [Planctomycetota bacterium]
MLLLSLPLLLFPSLPAPSLPAQGSLEAGTSALPVLRAIESVGSGLLLDEPGDGRTWARGATYKASFGPEGLTYRPFLGSDAPRSYPLRLGLAAASIGDGALPLGPRALSRDGKTVELDRGSAREVYLVDERSVEQTFVFDDLPRRGEMTLLVSVETDLVPSLDPGGGFQFRGDLGGVHYGAATAYDGAGRACALQQRWAEGGIQIVVPADFVESAALPLVVDPVISSFGVTGDDRRQLDTDVAYDGQNDRYLIVWSEVESTFDTDVLCAFYENATGILTNPSTIDITAERWDRPSVANAYAEQQFLCVAIVGTTVSQKEAWGRTREADTGMRGSQFQISGVGAEFADVGGKGNDVASIYDYVVVWQEADAMNFDFDIVAQAVNGSGSLTGPRRVIDGDVNDLDRLPSISKSAGRPGSPNGDSEYMITWEREVGTDDRNLRCQVIEYTGSTTGHAQFSGYTFSDSRRPDVSTASTFNSFAGERHWVIVFERRTGTDYDIFAIVATDGNADNAKSVPVMQDLDQDLDHRAPKLANDGEDFVVAYRTEVAPNEYRVYSTALNVIHDGDELRVGCSVRRDTIGRSIGVAPTYGITTEFDGGLPQGNLSRALLLWVGDQDGTDPEVFGAMLRESRRHVVGSQYCDANENSTGRSAWMSARSVGPPNAVAGGIVDLECVDVAENSFGHFLCSLDSGFVPNPGGSAGNLCLQGAVGRFNRPGEVLNSGFAEEFELRVDTTSFPSPSGSTSVLAGQTWYFQTWFRDFGPTSNFSNGVQVTFD